MGLRTRLKSKAKAIASRVVHRHDNEQSTSEPIATPEEELMALEAEIEPAVELGPDLVEPEVAPSVEAEAEVAQAPPRPPKREDEEAKAIQAAIIELIQTIFDPEIPVNIYALGLIYDVDVHEDNKAFITMTLTSPNCPAAQSLPADVKVKAEDAEGIDEASVEVVWDPVWGPHLMTEAARLELNL
jgi:FeS assembly SUF system protein